MKLIYHKTYCIVLFVSKSNDNNTLQRGCTLIQANTFRRNDAGAYMLRDAVLKA